MTDNVYEKIAIAAQVLDGVYVDKEGNFCLLQHNTFQVDDASVQLLNNLERHVLIKNALIANIYLGELD
jgi:hypothetical protein